MSKNALEVLFDSRVRTKILKFLFRNPSLSFTVAELADATQEDISTVRKEVVKFRDIGLLRPSDKKADILHQNDYSEEEQ